MTKRTKVLIGAFVAAALLSIGLHVFTLMGGPRVLFKPSDYVEGEAPPQLGDPLVLVDVAQLGVPVTDITGSGDGSGRLFVAGKNGVIHVLGDTGAAEAPFLDISGRVSSEAMERGLLGIAFPPDFAASGRVYVNYTGDGGTTHISSFESDGRTADPASEVVLLRIEQPYSNHNGGQVHFGPDGMLYIATGDGGAGGDPADHGENPHTLLGALLRIDPTRSTDSDPYAVPQDNPFADGTNGAPEVWAYGLRNPWRFTFDDDGRIWIADVGQSWYEEVDLVDVATGAGTNFGWDVMEGTQCFEPTEGCDDDGLTAPVYEYDHGQGCSITGGVVVGPGGPPSLDGVYLFTDYCGGWIRGLRPNRRSVDAFTLRPAGQEPLALVAFGKGDDGAVYVIDLSGGVFRVED